jgi:hypothetical protein
VRPALLHRPTVPPWGPRRCRGHWPTAATSSAALTGTTLAG